MLAAAMLGAAFLPQGARALTGKDFSVTGEVAVLQGLDKVTARVSRFEVGVGETVDFGSLSVTLRSCRKTPPTEEPESAAFLEIDDSASGGAAEDRVFSGWMFASSPGLSALEHPVYDVWLLDCSTASSAAEDAPAEN